MKIIESEKGTRSKHCLRTEKPVELKGNGKANCNQRACNGPEEHGKGARKVRNWGINRNHSDYSIVEIVQNTKKVLETWGGFAITQISMKDHQTMLVGKLIIQDIGMEFGIEKCAILAMKSGKRHMTEGMELPNHDKIRTHEENEIYKYLGILEADTIKQV